MAGWQGKLPPRRVAALLVHGFTASGAVVAFLALMAAIAADWPRLFALLALALFIDGIDGSIARLLKVREHEPRYSGEVLDLVVDFLTYVFIPAYALLAARLLPDALAMGLVAAILLSSAFYFADGAMKTLEGGFRGFPALWNVAAFLLFVLHLPPAANAAIVAVLVAMTFAPITFVHPIRVRRLRPLTLAMLGLWCAAAAWSIVAALAPPPGVVAALIGASAYFLALPLAFGRPAQP